MKTSKLTFKVWPKMFEDIVFGRKPFHLCRDYGYVTGQDLQFREWTDVKEYTGRTLIVRITYVLTGRRDGQGGLREGFCVLGIKPVQMLNSRG